MQPPSPSPVHWSPTPPPRRGSTPLLDSNPPRLQLPKSQHPQSYADIPSSFSNDSQRASKKPRAAAVQWSAEMTTVLVKELVRLCRAGKRSDNRFKIHIWNEVAMVVMKVAPNEVLTGEKCQSKLEGLRKKWNVWSRLMMLSGFGRDPTHGTPTTPGYVWEQEIRVRLRYCLLDPKCPC